MKILQSYEIKLISLIMIIAFATTVVAGCTDSASAKPGVTPSTITQQSGHPVTGTTTPTKTTPTPAQVTTTLAGVTVTPYSSTGVIKLDPISDKSSGDTFTLTGTTSLPTGTTLLWQVMPDTGTPPSGPDKDSTMSVMGNDKVLTGDGTTNKLSVSVNLGRLVPGKYVAIVGKMKGDPAKGTGFDMGSDYGYTYFTLR